MIDSAIDSSRVVRYKNARVVKPGEPRPIIDELWVQGGKIIDPQKYFYDVAKRADEEVDCKGLIIAPGYIDIQCNGGYGINLSEIDDLTNKTDSLSKKLLEHGVTGFCPTIISIKEGYEKVIEEVKPRKGGVVGAEIIGLHLEGPFITKMKRGCHPEDNIRDTVPVSKDALLKCYGDLKGVQIITLAPELLERLDTIELLKKEYKDMQISIGHSCASYEVAAEAVDKGVTLVTHLFNAMLPFHHRDPGIIGLMTRYPATDEDKDKKQTIFYGLITDAHHTSPNAVRVAYRANKEGIIIISDSSPVTGCPDGKYKLNDGTTVEVKNDICVIFNTNTLAGSIAMMDKCVIGMMEATGCSIGEAMEAASLHPAQLLKIDDRKGSLEFGKDADFIILNDNLQVQATYIAGERVWSCPKP